MNWKKLTTEIKSLQFVWFLCHVCVLLGSFLFLLSLLSLTSASLTYQFSLSSALAGFLIILYKSHPNIKFTREFLSKVMLDEGVQYLLMSIAFLFAPPNLMCLVPFAVFSLFHAANYSDSLLLPIVVGNETRRKAIKLSIEKLLSSQTDILIAVARLEVLLVFFMIFQIFMRGSLIAALMYYQIINLRFMIGQAPNYRGVMYQPSKRAFGELEVQMDGILLHPRSPQLVQRAYNTVKQYIQRSHQLPTRPA